MSPSPHEFPLWARGRYFEDFEVNQEFDHHWGRTLRGYDSTLFSSLLLHYVPMYFNDEWAAEQGKRPGLINPYFVFLLVMGMSVEDTSEGVDGAPGAFLGVEKVDFLADVAEGDTITARTLVTATRGSKSRPEQGIVSWRTTGRNQRGIDVLRFERSNLVARRPASESFTRHNARAVSA